MESVTINNCAYSLTNIAIENSKFLTCYLSKNWINRDPINIPHIHNFIEDKHVIKAVDILNTNTFRIDKDIFVLRHILDYLECSALIEKLDQFIKDNVDELRRMDINIFLLVPDLISDISEDELLTLLEFIDIGLFTFGDLCKFTLAEFPENGGYYTNGTSTFDIYKLEKYLHYVVYFKEKIILPSAMDEKIRVSYKTENGFIIPKSSFYEEGEKILVSKNVFEERLNTFTEGHLRNLSWDNVVLAGGCLSLLLSKNHIIEDYPTSDVDLFVYGNEDERKNKMQELVAYFHNTGIALTYQRGVIVSVFVRGSKRNFQIINSGWKKADEIIEDFDLSISQIYFDGKQVKCTGTALISLLHQSCLVLKHERVHLSRFIKTLDRGYSLIFPNSEYSILTSNHIYIKEDLLNKIDILREDMEVVSSMNKYLYVTDEPLERVTYLVKLIFGEKYKLIHAYDDSITQPWWIDHYTSDENNLEQANLYSCRRQNLSDCILYVPVNKISPDTYLTRDIYLFRLVDQCGRDIIVNLYNCVLLSTYIPSESSFIMCVKISPSMRTKLDKVVTKLCEMVWAQSRSVYISQPIDMYNSQKDIYPDSIMVAKNYNKKNFPLLIIQGKEINDFNEINLGGKMFNLSIKVQITWTYKHFSITYRLGKHISNVRPIPRIII